MSFSFNFNFSNDDVQGLIFVGAAIFVLLSIWKAKRTNQKLHLKWLVPLAVYVVDEAVTYAITNAYDLLGIAEPRAVSTVIHTIDDVTLLAFLWALIVLWRIIRSTAELLKTPWINGGETPEGVWPPAPKV